MKILDWKGGHHPPEAAKILARLKGQVDEAGLASAERAARRISLQDHSHGPTSSKKPTLPTTTTDTSSTSSSAKVNGGTSKRDSIASISNQSQPTNHPIPGQSTLSASTKASTLTNIVDDTSTTDDDDGFGDFVDFSSDLTSTPAQNGNPTPSTDLFASPNPNGINGPFTQIDLNAQPLQPTKAQPNGSAKTTNKQEEDLLMLFDDGVEDIGLNHATPAAAPSKPATNTGSLNGSTRRNSIQSNMNTAISNNTSSSSTTSSSPSNHHSSSLSRDLFIAYFKYLMPYYISLQYQSTSSLIFTQSQPAPLTDIEKAYILSNLTRLLGNKSISPTQYEETRLKTTRRNLQSSIDYFNAFLLGKFEKSSDQRIISKMREAAWASYALNDTSSSSSSNNSSDGGNGASSSSSASSSVIQVFINKIPLFYDSSWDPLANLT